MPKILRAATILVAILLAGCTNTQQSQENVATLTKAIPSLLNKTWVGSEYPDRYGKPGEVYNLAMTFYQKPNGELWTKFLFSHLSSATKISPTEMIERLARKSYDRRVEIISNHLGSGYLFHNDESLGQSIFLTPNNNDTLTATALDRADYPRLHWPMTGYPGHP
jgi:hypothetical protein